MSGLEEALGRNVALHRRRMGAAIPADPPPWREDNPPRRQEIFEAMSAPRITFVEERVETPAPPEDPARAMARWLRPAARRYPSIGREEELL